MPLKHLFNPKQNSPIRINLNNMMGDKYAEAYTDTLQLKGSRSTLDLSNNRLSQKDATAILKKMLKFIQSLDLSNNPSVKDLDIKLLITDYKLKLKQLNIEGNNVGENLEIKLCKAI